MAVWALGLNHKTAPLDLRGRFALAEDQLPEALAALRKAVAASLHTAVDQVQAAILSTCNRTELYCSAEAVDTAASPQQQTASALQWLSAHGDLTAPRLERHTYSLHAHDAARHAFKVASGLDSMVLGESQILGQFKDAVRVANEQGALGATLNQLFQRSFSVAKAVKSQTELSQASISMPAAAVKLAEQLFEDLRKTRMLFVGAGEMVELAATHFSSRNPKAVWIANRSAERGQALAAKLNEARAAADGQRAQTAFAQHMALADLPNRLHEFDVVVSCTASSLPIIGLGAVERALKARKHQPMFMVDLAVPRDIEPEVQALSDVYLYTVDDLAQLVQQGKASRQAAVAQAQTIVDAGVSDFMHWMQQRQAVPLIQRINAQADAWAQVELGRARKALARGDDVDTVLEALSKGLMQKALHGAYAGLNAGDALVRDRTAQAVEQVLLRH